MKKALWLTLAMLPALANAQKANPPAHFEPLAFLAGSCWKGQFADGKQLDEHCFEWVYGGFFLRDRHTVSGGPAPYGGETIYYFDAPSKTMHYLYINVLGGNSRGTVTANGDVLQFPEEQYRDGTQQLTYRSSWRRDGNDAYVVLTESKTPDGWKEAWRVRMERQKKP
ncbi:hypothetical protein [Piscinibacter sakaiensis]|uniref:hypothetical protein n=1 Tax=Piscinibacter sakaiensis TaxID=1547922 RepID=UPI003AACEE92